MDDKKRIIDVHAHIGYLDLYPEYFLNGIMGSLVQSIEASMGSGLNKQFFKNILTNTLNDKDGSKLIKQMAESNIGKTVVLMTDLGYGVEDFPLSFEDMLEFHKNIKKKNPEKFLVFFGADPRRGRDKIALFEKSINEDGFSGLKLYPPMGFELDDKLLMPYYEICNQYGLPVLSHTGDSLGDMQNDYDYINAVSALATQFKHINFILAHITFSNFEVNLDLAQKYDNVFFDLAAFQLDWQNQALLEQKMKTIFRRIPEKILFGTDWPIYSMLGAQKRWVDYFQGLEIITEHDKALLFYKNAQPILKVN